MTVLEERVRAILYQRHPIPTSAMRILEALAAVPDNEGLTAGEISKVIGLGSCRVYALLRQMTVSRDVAVTSNVPSNVFGRVRVWRLP